MTIEHIHRPHTVSCLLYHLVSVVKYRRKIFTPDMEEYFKNICLHIEDGVEITFHEIGIDLDHVHFLIQSIPSRSPSSVVAEIRKETAREMFHQFPDIRKILRRGHFWTEGYYIDTVGLHSNQETIKKYIQNQGRPSEYKRMFISPDQQQFEF